MSHSLLFAKSLSLLLEEVMASSDVTTVRSGLLRVRRFSRSHGLTLELTEGKLAIDGIRLPRPVPGVQRLMLAMATHGVAQINIGAGAVPSELLKLTIQLSRPRPTDGVTKNIFEELREMALWYVQCYPAARTGALEAPEGREADVALESVEAIMTRGAALVQSAKTALREKQTVALVTTLGSLVAIETQVTHKDLKPAWSAAFEEVNTADVMHAVVKSLPTCGDSIGDAITVLKRSGDVAATLLIDELLASSSMDLRRACFDALIEVRRGTDRLLTMLADTQWFVVRNGALLLGEFGSRSSEPELTAALAHDDERVRAAVITALLQLDTATSRAAARGAIRDTSPEVRRRAVRGFLAETGTWTNVDKLLQALERETELDVQLEFLYAMGTLATPDAVQKLIRLCSSDGRYRSADFRIAAAEALASARLGAAVPLLRVMLKDPDQHARAAARHLIRAVS